MQKIIDSFNKLEIKIKGKLSHYPVLYAFIGGVGVVLFWRGVWHLADDFDFSSFLSLVVGFVILLVTGVFVSSFIGSKLIMSGLIGERKLSNKEEGEIETEETQLRNLQNTLSRVEKKLSEIETEVEKK